MKHVLFFYFDWLLLVTLVLIVGCVVIGTACIGYGSDDALWRTRAAVAIAIHNANQTQPSVRPTDRPEPRNIQRSSTPRPVVTMYSAVWCAPCRLAKAELQAGPLPFELKVLDVSQGGQPEWCESVPAFAWQVRGQTRYVLGFPGVARLTATWRATRPETTDGEVR